MRKVSVQLGDETIELVANFQASIEVNEKVRDPLEIMRFAALENMFNNRGIPYTPPWKFTVENIPTIIHIGAKAAESKLSLKDIQAKCFDAGFLAAQVAAVDYLTAIVGPSSEEELPKAETPAKKTKAGRG